MPTHTHMNKTRATVASEGKLFAWWKCDQGGRKVKRRESSFCGGAGERKARGEAAMADGRGEVQAEAGVKDCSSFQTLKLTVTRAQRPDRRVGT